MSTVDDDTYSVQDGNPDSYSGSPPSKPPSEGGDNEGDDEESSDEADELSTGIQYNESIMTKPVCPYTLVELQDEVKSLEAVIQELEVEKFALTSRLEQIEYFKNFDVVDCKKWLAFNFEFDRKDTPELLAAIFENYLMQSDTLDPLPHQLLVKNSSKAQARRERILQARSYLKREREKPYELEQAKPKKLAIRPSDTKIGVPSGVDSGIYGQHIYIHPMEIERLYTYKPWDILVERFPRITGSKSSKVEEIMSAQHKFLEANACAIWERNHWFPIKQDNGRSPEEVKQLGTQHNRRKRRQAQLKERLEKTAAEFRSSVDHSILEQTIFGETWVENILKRPRLWIPRDGENLLEQLHEVDLAEPERNFHLRLSK